MTSVLQPWVEDLTMMQQSVLLTAVRGPDDLPKYHSSKYLLRWYRRCILLSAMDGRILEDPVEPNGGSFTGPCVSATQDGFIAWGTLRDGMRGAPEEAQEHTSWSGALDDWVSDYLRNLDEIPHHYQLHFMHAVEIVGYKHPDATISTWWRGVYYRLAYDMHLTPETEETMDHRLGDSREQWLSHADPATRR